MKYLNLILKYTGILSLALLLLFAMLYAAGIMNDKNFKALILALSVLWFVCIPLSGRRRK